MGAALTLAGCSFTPRDSFTAEDIVTSQHAGSAEFKIWADSPAAKIASWLWADESKVMAQCASNYLALSGGGSGGAFSAGLLNGWSAAGTRPDFDIVSGVSTGALIAPFAFLGSGYDGDLAHMFDGEVTKDFNRPQNPLRAVSEGGLLDPEPLRRLIARYTTPQILARIAAEHRRGRRLLIVTTNLDAQRPVLWNLGAIAASNSPDAQQLVRSVLLASASVPAIYPPVMISASSSRGSFKEMHVDGGVTSQVFITPDILAGNSLKLSRSCKEKTHLWVAINNTQPPEFSVVRDNTVAIAMRTYSTVIKAETNGTVGIAYEASRRLGIDFNLAYISKAVPFEPTTPFGSEYMSEVFALGYQGGRSGSAWHKSPEQMAITAAQ